uniref:Uncharacterized protein n=1 Tax=Anguilla anguilla TaxID=7936 RepID=A0A0E9P7B0_ANGAN
MQTVMIKRIIRRKAWITGLYR